MSYADKKARLAAALAAQAAAGGPAFGLAKRTSNLVRDRESKARPRVDLSGFDEVIPIDPGEIAVSEFAPAKCHFGCRSGGSKTCSVNDEMTPDELRAMVVAGITAPSAPENVARRPIVALQGGRLKKRR